MKIRIVRTGVRIIKKRGGFLAATLKNFAYATSRVSETIERCR